MGQCKPPGLTKRGGTWHIDKQIGGTRVRESTGTGDLLKAQEHLAKRIDEIREARLFGIRGDHTFRAAATKYLEENQHKRSIHNDALHLRKLDPFIGGCLLRQAHIGALQEFIAKRRGDGVKTKSINDALAVVRRILNLAAGEWMDERGMTWLEAAPKIRLFPLTDARSPYPLSQEEQALLFRELPDHLARMALFKVNTGTREQEVCGLKWSYEVKVPELDPSVFKRGGPRPVHKMNNTAWKSARERAADRWAEVHQETPPEGFRRVRVHDLKHTFGRRLRAAGVSFEDRQDLLGHKSGRITSHYSQAELSNLIRAAESVCGTDPHNSPAVTWLRRKTG